MVAQFGLYGVGPVLIAKNRIARGRTLEGHAFEVSELLYNGPAFPGAQANKSYAVDILGVTDRPQAVGFATKEDAFRYVSSGEEEEYAAHDLYGNEGKTKRVGMGVPDGLMSRSDGGKMKSETPAPQSVVNPAMNVPVQPSANPVPPASVPMTNLPQPSTAPTPVTPVATGVPGYRYDQATDSYVREGGAQDVARDNTVTEGRGVLGSDATTTTTTTTPEPEPGFLAAPD